VVKLFKMLAQRLRHRTRLGGWRPDGRPLPANYALAVSELGEPIALVRIPFEPDELLSTRPPALFQAGPLGVVDFYACHWGQPIEGLRRGRPDRTIFKRGCFADSLLLAAQGKIDIACRCPGHADSAIASIAKGSLLLKEDELGLRCTLAIPDDRIGRTIVNFREKVSGASLKLQWEGADLSEQIGWGGSVKVLVHAVRLEHVTLSMEPHIPRNPDTRRTLRLCPVIR